MSHRFLIYESVFLIILIIGSNNLFSDKSDLFSKNPVITDNRSVVLQANTDNSVSVEKINSRILYLSSLNDTIGLLSLADTLYQSVVINKLDSSTMSELYYYIGVCNLLTNKYNEAIVNLKHSVEIKADLHIEDNNYSKGIYNIGVAYNFLGDYIQVCRYMLDYIKTAAKLFGDNSPEVAEAYSILIGATIECTDYDNFIDYTIRVLGILSNNKDALAGDKLSLLYNNIGIGYVMMSDYAKARIYLEQAETLIKEGNILPDINYINLTNSLAITYRYLGLTDKEDEYYNKGIELAISDNSSLAFNMINSYAIALGNSGKIQKGDYLLSRLVERAANVYGNDSRNYIEVLKNYAEYLRTNKKDIRNSIILYQECINYLNRHKQDESLRYPVLWGYAIALYENGEPVKALETIQELLFYGKKLRTPIDLYQNPVPDSIQADGVSLRILRSKYEILWYIYSGSGEQKALEAAANTSELIISIIDKIRINISEEESRIVLGNRYRDSYLQAIRDFELCYQKTGNRNYLEKAFGFAEKSKVAVLLAATRELNAIQFHIPADVAEREKSLLREIGFYNSKIFTENDKDKPDKILLSAWKEKLLRAVNERDSLALTFKKDYPGYFTMKYDTRAPEMAEIPSLIGRNYNYINYILSDSLVYIFLINRKHQELLTFNIDSLFLKKIGDFRILLSGTSQSENARARFDTYQQIGYDLYKILIEPLREYFISDNLLISPDNILSYLPFETILSSLYSGEEILYRKLDYLMNDFNISYTYSATFMKEVVKRDHQGMNELIAFAPVYNKTINIDSIFRNRQGGQNVLYDLPYARQEAEFISDISNGTLYLNEDARESIFKALAGKYDIIHLAMHTVLNDQNPMNSAMIFAQDDDSPEDGLLYTYEVYGIPMKARMVVLSSCNTGSGKLHTGEGILSLARGFLYSGSQSVVMSMWEIDDKSGTDIIRMFYENLKKGKSKSEALRSARSSYLKSASQLRSHPYFWSSLVVYGENSPVYYSRWKPVVVILILLLLIFSAVYYLRYRKYS